MENRIQSNRLKKYNQYQSSWKFLPGKRNRGHSVAHEKPWKKFFVTCIMTKTENCKIYWKFLNFATFLSFSSVHVTHKHDFNS